MLGCHDVVKSLCIWEHQMIVLGQSQIVMVPSSQWQHTTPIYGLTLGSAHVVLFRCFIWCLRHNVATTMWFTTLAYELSRELNKIHWLLLWDRDRVELGLWKPESYFGHKWQIKTWKNKKWFLKIRYLPKVVAANHT